MNAAHNKRIQWKAAAFLLRWAEKYPQTHTHIDTLKKGWICYSMSKQEMTVDTIFISFEPELPLLIACSMQKCLLLTSWLIAIFSCCFCSILFPFFGILCYHWTFLWFYASKCEILMRNSPNPWVSFFNRISTSHRQKIKKYLTSTIVAMCNITRSHCKTE